MTSVALLGGGDVKRDILVYADVNLNLIDGSAVWLASLTEMLSLESHLNVHVLPCWAPLLPVMPWWIDVGRPATFYALVCTLECRYSCSQSVRTVVFV